MISRILKTLYLFTTLMCCSNSYSTEYYNPLYDIRQRRLSQYKIEKENNGNYGKLYYENSGKKFLIDKNGKYFYDLKTMLEQNSINASEQPLPNFPGGNLIVKELDDESTTTYTIAVPPSFIDSVTGNNVFKVYLPSDTTLIIPQGITLTKNKVLFRATDVSNITILNLGTLICDQYDANINIMKSDNIKVIIGPNSRFPQLINNVYGNDNGRYPVSLWNNNSSDNECTNVKYLLYPGCKLNNNDNPILTNVVRSTISQYGRLYLNRFLPSENERNELYGKISKEIHITYPNIKNEDEFDKFDFSTDSYKTYTINNFFPKIYWLDQPSTHTENTPDTKCTYDYEDFEAPLYYDDNNVLSVKPNDELAPYDAKLCKECGLNGNGKYNFGYYNTPENKDKYIDVDKIHEIFYGVDYDDNPIKIDTNTINPGLIGNKDVQLNTDEDNGNFGGGLILPSCVTGINYGDSSSKIDNSRIKRLDKYGEIDNDFDPSLLNITYSAGGNNNQTGNTGENNGNISYNNNGGSENNNKQHYHKHKNWYNEMNNGKDKIIGWDLAILGNKIHIDFDKYSRLKHIVVTLTNSNSNKYNFSKLIVKGDNRWVNGMIITTPEIDEVEFWKWSFIKTINISGKSLCYVFKHKNLFTPFIPYNRILADRSSDINIREVFKKPCKCKAYNCNIKHSKSYKHRKYYDNTDRDEERCFYCNPKHNKIYSINEYSDKECSCSCDSCE